MHGSTHASFSDPRKSLSATCSEPNGCNGSGYGFDVFVFVFGQKPIAYIILRCVCICIHIAVGNITRNQWGTLNIDAHQRALRSHPKPRITMAMNAPCEVCSKRKGPNLSRTAKGLSLSKSVTKGPQKASPFWDPSGIRFVCLVGND